MKISGFTYVRNSILLDFPIIESIKSALPLCDEFIVICGKSDDNTLELIEEIDSPKIRIIETVWNIDKYSGGTIHSQQANIGLSECKGDWVLYLQADELIHEKDYTTILDACKLYLENERVDGFLFSYKHFWGDYNHYQWIRKWYRREIRIVRNHIGVKVWGDAQGFRKGDEKLKVILLPCDIYHYGWVRDPNKMKQKIVVQDRIHHDDKWVDNKHPQKEREIPFEYGNLEHLKVFTGRHPSVMNNHINRMNWKPNKYIFPPYLHNRLGLRLVSWIEDNILHFRIGEYRNYRMIGKYKS